jgi:hypothetical protein
MSVRLSAPSRQEMKNPAATSRPQARPQAFGDL